MISVDYVAMMARYNAWQNDQMLAAADTLDDTALRADRGAFFGSILRTMSHLLWADLVWMSRLDGWPKPGGTLDDSPDIYDDWRGFCDARRAADAKLQSWAGALDPTLLDGDLKWVSGINNAEMTMGYALCVSHLFNHQAHHRGQINAMLTAAGQPGWRTDLPFMPDV